MLKSGTHITRPIQAAFEKFLRTMFSFGMLVKSKNSPSPLTPNERTHRYLSNSLPPPGIPNPKNADPKRG